MKTKAEAMQTEAKIVTDMSLIFGILRKTQWAQQESLVWIDEFRAMRIGGFTVDVLRLVGAKPSGWERLTLVIEQPVETPAVFLLQHGRLIPMWPFAVPGPKSPHVFLFDGFVRDRIRDWSTDGESAHEDEDEARRRAIEEILGPAT